jgi:hypothetical protein
MQYSTNATPTYPLTPGARVPELNLAGVDGLNVASGQSIQSMPDPVAPPMPAPLSLQGSPEVGGIDPQTPIPVLNLAGVEGVPSPTQLAQTDSKQIHEPDFGLPDFIQPSMQAYDLTEPGLTQIQNPLYAPDPLLPDLDEYRQPYGLTIHNRASGGAADPFLDDLLRYDTPQGITILRDIYAPDPLLPDLQHPQLTQDVHMKQRPADLDASALQQLHASPLYQQLNSVPYRDVFIDQADMNTSGRRHYDLLFNGLDNERR